MSRSPFFWHSIDEKIAAYKEAAKLASIDYQSFYDKEAGRLIWQTPYKKVHDNKFAHGEWFVGGKLNVSENCLDRHIKSGLKDKTAIIFENEDKQIRKLSYEELHSLTLDIATMLHNKGIGHGDRVAIYMPMWPEAIASMLACARIGAIHTVVFGGFSSQALADRIIDAEAKAVITAFNAKRKGKRIGFLEKVKEALTIKEAARYCKTILTFTDSKISEFPTDERITCFKANQNWPDHIKNPQGFDAQDPLFILYTSGTTGKPKGIYHAMGGYLTQCTSTSKWMFDFKDDDLFWCTADIGWITGHSYVTYGPLSLGATLFIYDGALNFPDQSRIYKLIDDHKITMLYTAPTAIRMFMQAGDHFKNGCSLKSLRLLGSVGEPINPEAYHWYKRVFGNDSCPIIDTWWQTETGAIMISPMPHIHDQIPGCATKPFLGIDAAIVDENGKDVATDNKGYLVIKRPWPSLARGVWQDETRFHDTYFSRFNECYFTGDGARVDNNGNFTISGRIDDVINISGHRIGSAEVESALVAHPSIAEAAVVGVPDEITGEGIVAFTMLMSGITPTPELKNALTDHVKKQIGSFAKPREIRLVKALPKTRSGKIMRRLLRNIASGKEITSDISTLEDETMLKDLV